MKVQLLVCALLCVVAYAAGSDVDETSMEEVASFVETAAELDALSLQTIGTEHVEAVDSNGFPVPLTKKQRRTTMEPQYLGEPLGRKKYIVPEYAVPKLKKHHRRHHKNKPRVFSSHYFSPMPKPKKGGPTCKAGDKKCRRRWKKAAARRRRRNTPLKSIETYNHHLIKKKGFVNPEIVANYPGGPRGRHLANKRRKNFGKPQGLPKKTLAPAPVIKFLEISAAEAETAVDTSAEAESQGVDEDAEFSEEELAGREQVTVLNGPEQFFEEGFQAPDWADEEMAEDEESTDESAEEADSESEEATEEESADEDAAEADADVAMIEESDEDEESDESEDEDEESDEGEDEEAADEESEDESEEEETEEVSLIEAAAESSDEDEEEADDEDEDESNSSQEDAVDEMEENELVAEQIDMDATVDDADQDEEVDEDEAEEEEEADEDEAQEEAEQEVEQNEEAVAEMFEVDNHLNEADTLLAEVDAHLTAHTDADAETETEASKGTPGSAVSAGQTWEDAQNEKLDALEAHLAAERAATPKFQAKVVASTADLAAVDAEHQLPEYDQEEETEEVETVAPEYAF